MTCENLTFGTDNQIPDCALTSNVAAVTDLNWLKTHFAEERTRWVDFTSPEIVIDFTMPEVKYADYFAFLGSNLSGDATVKLELFETDTSTVDLLQLEAGHAGQPIPIGLWRAGIDGYNVRQDAEPNSVYALWFDRLIKYKRGRVTITHGYVVSEETTYNDTPQMSSSGVLSLEAEDCTVSALGSSTWANVADADASSGECLHKTGGGYYGTSGDGPSFSQTFAASISGTHKVWVRVKSTPTTGNDSFFVDVDGGAEVFHFPGHADGGWHWLNVRSVSLQTGVESTVTIYAREDDLYIDKVVIQRNSLSAPTGSGPPASGFGIETTSGSTETVEVRMLMLGQKLQMQRNYSYGATTKAVSAPKLVQTDSGHYEQAGEQHKVRSCNLNLEAMTNADQMRLQTMEQTLLGTPFLLAAHKGHAGWTGNEGTYLGRFINPLEYQYNFTNRHAAVLQIGEV